MTNTCVVFTTDPNYLYPTLIAADSARKNLTIGSADVLILCFGAERSVAETFQEICTAMQVTFLNFEVDALEGGNAMMARLFLDQLLPTQYESILYMDGDILVTGSLDPLVHCKLPKDTFLAANDPGSFAVDDQDRLGSDLRKHFLSLGLTHAESRNYFNSGILRFDRTGWKNIAEEAWQWFCRHDRTSRFPDQDAMNVVGRSQRLKLSLGWNFPSFMMNARVSSSIQPRVHHFMSSPKPWHGTFAPWGNQFREAYQRPMERFPQLISYWRPLPVAQMVRYSLQQRAKQVFETITWGRGVRRSRILSYEQSCHPLGSASSSS